MCRKAMIPRQEEPPLHPRRGLVMLRPRLVATSGHVRLLCDDLHDGPHQWPEAFLEISAGDADELASDSVDEGEIVVD